jgi:hypothetical protein
VSLICAIDCGSPSNYTYTWTFGSDISLQRRFTTELRDKLDLNIVLNSTNQTFEYFCSVSNGINTTMLENIKTKFIVKYGVEPTTTTTIDPFTNSSKSLSNF